MNAYANVRLVAVREMRERITSRSFQVSTAVTVLLVLGAVFLPALFASDEAPSYTVGTVGDSPAELDQLIIRDAPDPGTEVVVDVFADRNELERALQNNQIDLGVIDATLILTGPDSDPQLVTIATGSLQAMAIEQRALGMGLTAEQLSQIFVGGVAVESVDEDDDAEERTGLAFFGTILLFVSIVTYGQWILIGVVEEKTSRVVEVILGAVKPRDLLAGKVIGIGALGLAQLVLIALVGLFAAAGYSDLDLPPIGPSLALIIIGWFVLGFAFFAAGYAVAGSLVSRQEDAQNASFPLTMVLMVAYFVAASALGGGDNPVLRALSIIPPFSPLTMPIRQATGAATTVEVAVSVTLMVLAIIGILRVGGRVYAAGLLRSGGRTKLRHALRNAET